MTNTTIPAHTATGIVCGRCSYGFGSSHVQLRHASIAEVRACYSIFTTPVVEVPAPAPGLEPAPTTFERHFAKCPKTGCSTVKVKNRPHVLRCFNHGKVVRVRSKQLVGTLSKAAKHVCDSRCINARGPECVCACGGVNHGIGHLASA